MVKSAPCFNRATQDNTTNEVTMSASESIPLFNLGEFKDLLSKLHAAEWRSMELEFDNQELQAKLDLLSAVKSHDYSFIK